TPAGPKKPPPAERPKVLLALPLGVRAGATTRLTLRGLKLDAATGLRVLPRGSARVVKKGKVGVPMGMDARRIGDTGRAADLTVPADGGGDKVTVAVQAPGGEGAPHALFRDRVPPVAEKEPNDGFKQAQPVAVGQTVQGSIGRPQDVDTFRLEG